MYFIRKSEKMGTYVKKFCGKCGKAIEGWHNDPFSKATKIGCPLIKCPHCGYINIDKYVKEYTMLSGYDYFKMYVPNIWGSIGISIILTAIIILIFKIENTTIFLASFTLLFILCLIYGINKEYKNIQKEINLSKERLKDEKYKKLIDKINEKTEHWYNVK